MALFQRIESTLVRGHGVVPKARPLVEPAARHRSRRFSVSAGLKFAWSIVILSVGMKFFFNARCRSCKLVLRIYLPFEMAIGACAIDRPMVEKVVVAPDIREMSACRRAVK